MSSRSRFASHRVQRGLPLCFILLLFLASSHSAQGSTPPIKPRSGTQERAEAASQAGATGVSASYRTQIHPQELASWLESRIDNEPGSELEALKQLVLVRHLASEAQTLQLSEGPAERWESEFRDLEYVWNTLLQHVYSDVAIDEEQVREQAALLSTKPRRVRLRNLFKRYPPDATQADRADLRQEIEALRERAMAGEDFAALAAAESDSQTRLQEGLLGNVRPGDLRPAVEKVAFALQVGEVSPVLEEEEGFTLLYCEKILPAVNVSPGKLEDFARNRLNFRVRRQLKEELRQELLAASQLQVDLDGVELKGPEAQVASWVDGRLTVADLSLVWPDIDPTQLQPRIEALAIWRMARLRFHQLGLEDEKFRRTQYWYRQEDLAGKALLRRVQARFAPLSEEEIRQAYEQHRERYQHPKRFHLEAIELEIDPADPRPAHDLAARLRQAFDDDSVTFAEAAQQHSRHASAARGGKLGRWPQRWVSQRLGLNLTKALSQMQEGEISKPVVQDQSLWLLHLVRIEPPVQKTFAEAANQIEQSLGQARANELEKEVLQALWLELAVQDAEGNTLE